MRPVLAILITITLIGGVYGYLRFADGVRRSAVEIEIDYAGGEYSVEIERTFDTVGDPILGTESLKVLLKGETLFAESNPIPFDQPVVVSSVEGLETGENEIFVTANRASAQASGLAVIQVTIKRNDIPLSTHLLLSEPGLSRVGGPVVFTIGHSDQTVRQGSTDELESEAQ